MFKFADVFGAGQRRRRWPGALCRGCDLQLECGGKRWCLVRLYSFALSVSRTYVRQWCGQAVRSHVDQPRIYCLRRRREQYHHTADDSSCAVGLGLGEHRVELSVSHVQLAIVHIWFILARLVHVVAGSRFTIRVNFACQTQVRTYLWKKHEPLTDNEFLCVLMCPSTHERCMFTGLHVHSPVPFICGELMRLVTECFVRMGAKGCRWSVCHKFKLSSRLRASGQPWAASDRRVP